MPHRARGAAAGGRIVARRADAFARLIALLSAAMLGCLAVVETASAGIDDDRLIERRSLAGSSEFPAGPLWKSVAEIMLAECAVALSHVPRAAPAVGLTEESAPDIPAAQRELARWRLTMVFTACTDLTREIIAAQDPQQEMRAWIKLTGVLADEQTVRLSIERAGILVPAHDESDVEAVFRMGQWRTVRNAVFETMLKFVGKP